jgi:hypothetical protein
MSMFMTGHSFALPIAEESAYESTDVAGKSLILSSPKYVDAGTSDTPLTL